MGILLREKLRKKHKIEGAYLQHFKIILLIAYTHIPDLFYSL